MELSKRLTAVSSIVPEGCAVLDIGCDHAYVPMELVSKGRAPFAVASDVREGPLAIAKEHIDAAGLSDKILTVLSDGVPEGWRNMVRGDVPVAVITAGMGGLLICDIFQKAPDRESIRYWAASPQRDVAAVRRTFTGAGFEIKEESFVEEDGKYYPVILFEQTGNALVLTEAEAQYGPVLLKRKDPVLWEYLGMRRARLFSIAASLPPGQERRRQELLDEAAVIEGLHAEFAPYIGDRRQLSS